MRLFSRFAGPLLVLVATFQAAGCDLWPADRELSCGDDSKADEEVCDGADLGGVTCQTLPQGKWSGGVLRCNADCSALDESGCFRCGDGKMNSGEVCDGVDLGGKNCKSLTGKKWQGGTLKCKAGCAAFDESGCYRCGDKLINGKEVCDVARSLKLTCKSLSGKDYSSGTLKCKSDCTGYDESGCTFVCGDNNKNGEELCDGTDLGGLTCKSIASKSYHGGVLKCQSDCAYFDDAACTYCGDGKQNGPEVCDGAALGGKTCAAMKDSAGLLFKRGKLGCNKGCDAHDKGQCTYWDFDLLATAGGPGGDSAAGVAVDGAGNIYITGGWNKPGISWGGLKVSKQCNSMPGLFVSKLDSKGQFLWTQYTIPCYLTEPAALAVDAAGNSYSVGTYMNWMQFPSNVSPSIKAQGTTYDDVYVIKLKPDGKRAWLTSAGGHGPDYVDAVALDGQGNAYLAGGFSSYANAKFGSKWVYGKSSGNNFETNGFVAKLDPTGVFVWAVGGGGYQSTFFRGIAVAKKGRSVVVGSFESKANFKSDVTSKGKTDMVVAAIDAQGNFVWDASAGGTAYDYGRAVALDSAGNSYVTGSFQGQATFGSATVTATGGRDIFVAKLDNKGKFLWVRSAGGATDDGGTGVAVDPKGNVLITGAFRGQVSFGKTTLSAQGSSDIFVAKLDNKGGWLWAAPAGGSDTDEARGIAVDSKGNAVIAGSASTPLKFGDLSGTSHGYDDIFVTRVSSSR